jgi:hypothetical protein
VRRLELTATGHAVRRRLDRDIAALRAPFDELTVDDLATLAALLARATPEDPDVLQ